MQTIISTIEDEFEGTDDEAVYKLDNGQAWQQVGCLFDYHYAYRPRVKIEAEGSVGVMHVEGFSRTIRVRRIE